jgi:hypothetical protein
MNKNDRSGQKGRSDKSSLKQLSQNGLLAFQIFLNGFDAIAGIGNADGVVPAQFVVNQQFANHNHLKIRLLHAPELPCCQGLLGDAGRGLRFLHGSSCALTFDLTS